MQMLKKLKAENEAKSKEAENSKNSKSSSEKDSGLAKTDEKVRKALESTEKKSSEKSSDDISDKTRALLEDKKSKDSSKAAPPPPPPKKPKDLDSSFDATSNRARKSVSLVSLIGKKDLNKENGDSIDKKTDKPTKRSSSDKRNTNSPTGKVQSKMTSFVTKDDKKDRRDSITTGTTYLYKLVHTCNRCHRVNMVKLSRQKIKTLLSGNRTKTFMHRYSMTHTVWPKLHTTHFLFVRSPTLFLVVLNTV